MSYGLSVTGEEDAPDVTRYHLKALLTSHLFLLTPFSICVLKYILSLFFSLPILILSKQIEILLKKA